MIRPLPSSRDGQDVVRLPDSRMITNQVAPPTVVNAGGSGLPNSAPEDSESIDRGVRPFVVTGGRTVPVNFSLPIETQIVATSKAADLPLEFEARRIVGLCRSHLSIAEIGAALQLPFGVVRVLVADLATAGAITVQQPERTVSRDAIKRILERVNAL